MSTHAGRKKFDVEKSARFCWTTPIGITLLLFSVLALVALCVFIWVVTVRINDADNTNTLNAELLSNTRILEVISAFARTVTRQDWVGNVELFAADATINFGRAMTFLTGASNLPADTTTSGGWGQQLSVFAGGFTSNHMMLSNCNISYADPITASVLCTGMYTYSLRYSTVVSTINYPTQFIVFQSLFSVSDPFAHNEWLITDAVALVNATNTLLNSIETGVAPPGAVTTKRTNSRARFDIAIWQLLLAQITHLIDVGQIDTALAICRTEQYVELKQVYDPYGTDPANGCNTETQPPVTFTSPIMCTESGLIDASCFNISGGGGGGGGPIPDRVRTINLILPEPSVPATSSSLNFAITGGNNVAITGGMHGIVIDAVGVTCVNISMPTDVYSVTGNPIETTGTFVITHLEQLQHHVWAGPSSGGFDVPTFRLLSLSELAGVLSATQGGTGNNGTYSGNRFIVSNGAGTALVELDALATGFFYVGTGSSSLPAPGTLLAGDHITIVMVGDSFLISGELVLLVVPADLFQDVSINETLAFEVIPQFANYVWAGPASGGAGLPFFRLLVPDDIPIIDLADTARITGILDIANGGTNNAGPYSGMRIIMTNAAGTSLIEGTIFGINGISVTTGPGAFVIIDGSGLNGTCGGGGSCTGSVNASDVFCNAELGDACIPDRVRTINGLFPSAAPIFNFNILAGTGTLVTPGVNDITISNTGVTNVALLLPVSTFSISGSPVSTTGTLTAAFTVQSANAFLVGPTSGPSATPTWRSMVFGDMPVGSNGDIYYISGGTVTSTPLSIALAVPSAEFAVSGSPITSPTGTFTLTKQLQLANHVWAGPVTGASAQPEFRELVAADVQSALGFTANGQLIIGAADGSFATTTLTAGTNVMITNGPGASITINAISTVAVTSVALALPASTFSVSGSPVTTTGTLTGTLLTQSANHFFAGPTSGAAAVPTWRPIDLLDMPVLTNGQVYIGSTGMAPVASQLTAGTLTSITPGMGTITISTTALGSVTLNMPTAIFDVASMSGTNTQTLTVTLDAQSANTVFAGPTSGGTATPTFRALVAADMPAATVGYFTVTNVTTTADYSGSTYIVMDGMNTTLASGTYYCSLSATMDQTTGSGQFAIAMFVNGIENTNSRRLQTGSTAQYLIGTHVIISSVSSLDVDVRWQKAGGSGTGRIFVRTLICLKLA